MSNYLDPVPGTRYRQPGSDRSFTVVAVDDLDGVIQVRFSGGGTEAIPLGHWLTLDLETVPAEKGCR